MVFGKCLLGHIVVGHSVLRLYLPKSFAGLPFCLAQRFRGLNLARCFIHGFPFARSSRYCPICSWAAVIGKVRLICRGSPRGDNPTATYRVPAYSGRTVMAVAREKRAPDFRSPQ